MARVPGMAVLVRSSTGSQGRHSPDSVWSYIFILLHAARRAMAASSITLHIFTLSLTPSIISCGNAQGVKPSKCGFPFSFPLFRRAW